MLKVQLPGFQSAQFLPQWPKPFLSGYGSAPLTIWPRHSPFQKQNYSIRSTLRKDNKPIPQPIDHPTSRKNFPPDFIFGTASSAYQYEGAAFEDGKGESNWDYFTRICPEKIKDGSNGVIAVDAYHKYKEDVALMKNLGVNAYRFSIAWTRILPNGKLSGGVNKAGIQYYNNLINELLLNGIQPFVTLFHWDVPHALEDEYGGFLSDQIIKDFKDFTDVCFKEFGDRVKFWITMNEPWTFTIFGYDQGTLRPGKADNRGTKPYVVVHNMLLAHAAVVDTYRKKYKETQNGQIGITLIYSWMIPYSENPADVAASQRASDFMLGWFMDPIARGEYPQSMQELVGPRLPKFNQEQSEMLKGSYDFIGLNYYTAIYTQDFTPSADNPCYTTDSHANLTSVRNGVPIGIPTAAELIYIYPEGLLAALNYIKEKYNNPVIYITENGTPDDSKLPKEQSLKDVKRKNALVSHLNNLLMAIKTGVDVRGYFVWSLLDCFEWGAGYTMRFGMHYVDFNDGLKRTQKDSALWFQNFLKEN